MGKKKCEHGRERSRCKDCGGSGICEHGRRRNQCKECGGGSICEHGRLRSQCKDCGGSSFCEHGRQRSKCKESLPCPRIFENSQKNLRRGADQEKLSKMAGVAGKKSGIFAIL